MTEKKPPVQPTPRRERRSRTSEEDSKALAWKLLKEEVEKDPQLRERYIAQVTGFDIAKAHREATEEKFRLEFLKLGFKEMEKEPDWAKDLARDAIYEAMGKKPPEPRPEEKPHRPTLDDLIDNYEMMHDFMKRKGCGQQPNTWEQILQNLSNPGFINSIDNLIKTVRGQPAPPPSGNYTNPPPYNVSEELKTPPGLDDFRYPRTYLPPPIRDPNLFREPSTVKEAECSLEARQTTLPGSAKSGKERSQPDIASDKRGSANDVNPPPNAQGETGQWSEASRHGTKPEAQPPNEVNGYPDQSAPLDFKTDKDSGPSAEPLENEKPDDLEIDDKAAPIQPLKPPEVIIAELKALFEKTRKTKRDMADTEVLQPRPDRSENNEKAESKMEVESAPSATPPPQHARPKRAEPFFDFVPDLTPEALEELDKRRD